MRRVDEIIIHCSATRPQWMHNAPLSEKIAEIRRWHMQDRGFKDIGYHYIMDRNGMVDTGRPLEQEGAHVIGHNADTIGVCLIGGHGSAATDLFNENFTQEQDRTLRKLIADLRKRFPAIDKVSGHNYYSKKSCPGFSVAQWMPLVPKHQPKPVKASWWASIAKGRKL
jgi:N-acetylmuramoyl-L-alanine amidase